MAKFYWFLGHEQYQPEVLVRHAKVAELAGFDGLMVSEHFHPWVEDSGASGFAFTTLGAIASMTEKVQLITAVTTPLFRYHPAIVAQAAATVDRLSGGRFSLGIGSGEMINEAPLGIAFPEYKERAARLKESVEIMRKLLDGEKLTFRGDYYITNNAKLYSPPLHKVPIYIAAAGSQTATLTGRIAEGLITSVKKASESLDTVIKPAIEASAGKKLDVLATHWSVFAHSEDEAWRALRSWRGLRSPSRGSATDPQILQNEADSLSKQDVISSYSVLTSAQEFIDTYAPLVKDIKADIVGIQSTALDQEGLIDMIGKEVLPELRKI